MLNLIFAIFLSINVSNSTFSHVLYEVTPDEPMDISFEKPHGLVYLFYWSKCKAVVSFYNHSLDSEAVFTNELNEDTSSVESGQYLMKVHIESKQNVKVKFIAIIVPEDIGSIIVKTSRNTTSFTTTSSKQKSVSSDKNYLFIYYDPHTVTFSSDSILVCSDECKEVDSSYTSKNPEYMIIKPNYILEVKTYESTNSTSPLERIFEINKNAYFAARSSASLVYQYERTEKSNDFNPIFNVAKKYNIFKGAETLTDNIVALNNGTIEWNFAQEHSMLYLYTWTGNLTITLANPITGEIVVNTYKTGNGFTAFESGSYIMNAKLNVSSSVDKLKYIRFIGFINRESNYKRYKLQTNSDRISVQEKGFIYINYQDYVVKTTYYDSVGLFYYAPNGTYFTVKNLIVPVYASSPTYSDLSTDSLYLMIDNTFPINGTINVSVVFTPTVAASFVGINGITTIPFSTITPTIQPTSATSSSSIIPTTTVTTSSSIIPTTTTVTTSSSSIIPTTTTTRTTTSSSIIPTTTTITAASSTTLTTSTTSSSDISVETTTLKPSGGGGDDSDGRDDSDDDNNELNKYKKANHVLIIALAVVSVSFVILLVIFAVYVFKKKYNQIDRSDKSAKNFINTPLVY